MKCISTILVTMSPAAIAFCVCWLSACGHNVAAVLVACASPLVGVAADRLNIG